MPLTAGARLGPYEILCASRIFDLHLDGEQFLVAPMARIDPNGRDRLTFVFNFFDELRRLAPRAK